MLSYSAQCQGTPIMIVVKCKVGLILGQSQAISRAYNKQIVDKTAKSATLKLGLKSSLKLFKNKF